MAFEAKKRRGVIVYLYHLRQSKQLRRYGNLQYVSRKMKYALIYMDEVDVKKTVEISNRPDITTEFSKQDHQAYKLTEEDQEKFN